MFYVYLLVSLSDPSQRYVGFTTDVKQRVKAHNEGASIHTRKYKPWNSSPTPPSMTNGEHASSSIT